MHPCLQAPPGVPPRTPRDVGCNEGCFCLVVCRGKPSMPRARAGHVPAQAKQRVWVRLARVGTDRLRRSRNIRSAPSHHLLPSRRQRWPSGPEWAGSVHWAWLAVAAVRGFGAYGWCLRARWLGLYTCLRLKKCRRACFASPRGPVLGCQTSYGLQKDKKKDRWKAGEAEITKMGRFDCLW